MIHDQDDRPVGVDQPAEPRPERRGGRDRQRARHVGDRVSLGLSRVDDEGAPAQRGVERGIGQRRDLRDDPAEKPRSRLVERPHPREVARERGLAGEQRPREDLDLHRCQQRVVTAFEADGRPRRRGGARGAQRSGAVGRVDHHRILVAQEHVVERVIHRRGQRPSLVRAEQIRPPDRADEHRSAGQEQERLVRPGRVGDRIADVLGRMAGRRKGPEADRPDVERLAVGQRPVLVGELGTRPDEVSGSGQRGEVTTARHVVVVEVGLDDVGDAQVVRSHGVEVDVHVTSRVHHRSDTRDLIDDERRQVPEPLDPVLRDAHGGSLHRADGRLAGGREAPPDQRPAMGRAGTPTTVTPAPTSPTATAPAPSTAPSPMVSPSRTIDPMAR